MGAESKISRERLNQIALRKLTTFGLSPELDPSRQVLVGEWPFRSGQVVAPGTQVRIASGRFQVEGHDHLRFLSAPLASLGPLPFYDAESAAAFELRVARALNVRTRFLQSLGGQLAQWKIPVRLDGTALVLRGEVETTEHVFELEADPNGIRVVSLRSLLSRDAPTRASLTLKLDEYPTRSDLELYLSSAAHRGELGAAATTNAEPAAVLRASPAAAGALTVGLLQRFGPDVTLAVQNGRLEVSQELQVGSETYRFQAIHVSGPTFQAQLLGGGSQRWSDRFDLARFPGVLELTRICLGLPKPAPPQARPEAEASPVAGPAGFIAPRAGELWVMSVLVERETDGEIRYTCADLDGRPYGATRILGAEDFRATFSPHGAGWRLRIEIARADADSVVYRQLNAAGQKGPEKQLPLPTLMTVFLPEAQAY